MIDLVAVDFGRPVDFVLNASFDVCVELALGESRVANLSQLDSLLKLTKLTDELDLSLNLANVFGPACHELVRICRLSN